ncbi:EAL domain-containing protein [Pseudomonas sp. R2.Fl]|nr:EAL domain-containing protein [Pseudomonas sp. R2.Fl]
MNYPASERDSSVFPVRTVGLVVLGFAAAIVGAIILLGWSTQSIDQQSEFRQKQTATRLIHNFRSRLSHEQESATVWDDAAAAVRRIDTPDGEAWVDSNLGVWMHGYFGHDAAFILDPADKAVYASEGGERVGNDRYAIVSEIVHRLAESLRDKLRRGDTTGLDQRTLTQSVYEYGYLNGHPAIFSLKPIVSDTGEIEQVPGEEYLHVAVRVLDGEFLSELAHEYGFENLDFVMAKPEGTSALAHLPLVKTNGQAIGYFVWTPYRPGFAFLRSISPGLLMILAMTVVATCVFAVLLHRRLKMNREQAEKIRYLASHDALTGLLNRASFERELERELASARGRRRDVAVLYLDLDRFKQINDTMGHGAGDLLIREVAQRIGAILPTGGRFCRNGGDEFNLFVPFRSIAAVEGLCAGILETIGQPFDIGGQNIFVGISIGVAAFPQHGNESSELVRKADVALYHAKASGRGRYAIFGAHMDALVRERAEIERDLRLAIDDPDQIIVHYQPKYVAQSGEVASVEALVRWQHPARGLLSPDFFIPIAEESGLIGALGRQVMRHAFRDAVKWPISSVAVNVSPLQWRDPGFALEVVSLLGESGLSARRVELEITESAWGEELEQSRANIAALRDIGIRIALDDFGTGFSSFGRLHDTDVDHLKIDRIFVEGIGRSPGDEAIVRAIIDLARAKGLMVTAEGVQTEEQRQFLKDAGCDELQGFLMSKPLNAGDIDALFNLDTDRKTGAR